MRSERFENKYAKDAIATIGKGGSSKARTDFSSACPLPITTKTAKVEIRWTNSKLECSNYLALSMDPSTKWGGVPGCAISLATSAQMTTKRAWLKV